jgi:organic radical activating enzyme
MKIAGFQPFTLSDYPGRVAAIVFTQGCNFRCPYCHNRHLIPAWPPHGELDPIDHVLRYLEGRAGQLDGVVVTGGEPTIHDDLPDLLRQLKALGLLLKLDTNGSRPRMLDAVILLAAAPTVYFAIPRDTEIRCREKSEWPLVTPSLYRRGQTKTNVPICRPERGSAPRPTPALYRELTR